MHVMLNSVWIAKDRTRRFAIQNNTIFNSEELMKIQLGIWESIYWEKFLKVCPSHHISPFCHLHSGALRWIVPLHRFLCCWYSHYSSFGSKMVFIQFYFGHHIPCSSSKFRVDKCMDTAKNRSKLTYLSSCQNGLVSLNELVAKQWK